VFGKHQVDVAQVIQLCLRFQLLRHLGNGGCQLPCGKQEYWRRLADNRRFEVGCRRRASRHPVFLAQHLIGLDDHLPMVCTRFSPTACEKWSQLANLKLNKKKDLVEFVVVVVCLCCFYVVCINRTRNLADSCPGNSGACTDVVHVTLSMKRRG
jgi:hypothetical protein